MSQQVVIIDYGMGNLLSVRNALDYLGATSVISADPRIVASAETLILPGVGSFRKAMQAIKAQSLDQAITEVVIGRGRKMLGICLGQQLMAEWGEEDGEHTGLGLITGAVTRLPRCNGLKIPHVGFNNVIFDSQSKLFAGLDQAADFYFVHSYKLEDQDRPGLSSLCHYGGKFLAAYEHQNIFATQFHPEKSQTNGLQLIRNFLDA